MKNRKVEHLDRISRIDTHEIVLEQRNKLG